MIIANNKDFLRLWFIQNLENIEKVIIPFNPKNSHWILLLLGINNCELFTLDPLGQLCEGSRNFESCHNVSARIFNNKFAQKILKIKTLQRVQQTDSFNCGVFICYYARQIISGGYFLSLFLFSFNRALTKKSGQCPMLAKKGTSTTHY